MLLDQVEQLVDLSSPLDIRAGRERVSLSDRLSLPHRGGVVIARSTFHGLSAVQLLDEAVRLTVLPYWGGKVAEIFDRRRKREWLFEGRTLTYEQCGGSLPAYGDDYVRRFDVGGFDECFPTVQRCFYPVEPWRGTDVPDHGEVWSIPWRAEVKNDCLRLVTHGVRLPYRLEKTIRLLGNGGIRFEYLAANPTPFPMPFLWSSHPLLAIRPGMRLKLPVETTRVCSAPSYPARHGDHVPWGPDLSCVPQKDAGIAVKLFSPPLTEGWAELLDPADGAAFRFAFDPAQVTHLGLWINYGGWAGVPGAAPYFNLGLEPCIGAPDSLDAAVHGWQSYGELPPHGTRVWWLEITVA